ncbi:MAG: bifunctional methylenetetrahydrofolate dehydrogenase/methenyltetrahydrofolate cyclohydrolase FolD [Candidatus Helarchaeota archaeon]
MIILDGSTLAEKIRHKLKQEISSLVNETGQIPGLATILVGNNPASEIYIRIKHKACKEVGIQSTTIKLPDDISEEHLISEIMKLNDEPTIHGILLQLPLPNHLNANKLMDIIIPEKDVDGFHPFNSGKLLIGSDTFIPCTPKGILTILDRYEISLASKNTVIINHSNIVGKPLALLLLNRNATVSICHEFTRDLKFYTKNADIIIIGIGNAKFLKKEMIKDGVVIIDVGINRIDGKLFGDVDFDDVKNKVFAITPVPGGVGPMTVVSLLENTIKAFKNSIET